MVIVPRKGRRGWKETFHSSLRCSHTSWRECDGGWNVVCHCRSSGVGPRHPPSCGFPPYGSRLKRRNPDAENIGGHGKGFQRPLEPDGLAVEEAGQAPTSALTGVMVARWGPRMQGEDGRMWVWGLSRE